MEPQAPKRPTLSIEQPETGGWETISLNGAWVMETADSAEDELSAVWGKVSGPVTVRMGEVDRLDTAGTWLVVRFVNALQGDGRTAEIDPGSPERQALIDVLSRTCEEIGVENMRAPPARGNAVVRFLEQLGRGATALWRDTLEVLEYLGASVWSLFSAVIAPDRLRVRSIVATLDQAGLKAVFIIGLMSFLIGAIICQQSAFYLRLYGGEVFAVDLVGTLVLREIGVLITAIMVAGRSGSAITAEIGSMKMREEIDALKVAGLDPVDVLIVPRLISLIIALPLLTILSNCTAMAGAALVSAAYSNIPIETFIQRFGEAVDLQVAIIGLVKAPFMAVVIGLIACMEGMKVKGSASSLGQQTTISVVKSIFMVIVMDGVFAMFFAAIGI